MFFAFCELYLVLYIYLVFCNDHQLKLLSFRKYTTFDHHRNCYHHLHLNVNYSHNLKLICFVHPVMENSFGKIVTYLVFPFLK